VPARVDETHHARLPPRCPGCGDHLVETGVATQYQEELPVPRLVVRAFQVHIGRCHRCGHRVQGRHALQTSDALGAAAAQLGPQAVAFAVILNKQLGLSYGKIATLFQQQYRLTVTRGGLVQAVHRAARHAQPTYAALCTTVRGSPMVSPDETGWKVGGHLQWLWAFATPETTVYRIQPGRGFDEAAAVLGADFAGVLVRDGWAPYRGFTAAAHQTCLAHLLRRCRLVATDHPRTTFATDVQAILRQGLAVRDRHHAGAVSAHGLAVARGHLITRLAERLGRPSEVPDVQRFAAHLERELPGGGGGLPRVRADALTIRDDAPLSGTPIDAAASTYVAGAHPFPPSGGDHAIGTATGGASVVAKDPFPGCGILGPQEISVLERPPVKGSTDHLSFGKVVFSATRSR